MGLVCIECAIDHSLEGDEWSPSVRADLVIGTDGTVKSSRVKGAPKALMQTVQEQIEDWLFEPPRRDGKPTEVAITIGFTVAAPRKKK
jgi:outer membrane biosynthesis protein TonB